MHPAASNSAMERTDECCVRLVGHLLLGHSKSQECRYNRKSSHKPCASRIHSPNVTMSNYALCLPLHFGMYFIPVEAQEGREGVFLKQQAREYC